LVTYPELLGNWAERRASSSVVDRDVGDAGYRDVLAPVLEALRSDPSPIAALFSGLCVIKRRYD